MPALIVAGFNATRGRELGQRAPLRRVLLLRGGNSATGTVDYIPPLMAPRQLGRWRLPEVSR